MGEQNHPITSSESRDLCAPLTGDELQELVLELKSSIENS